MFYGYAAFMTRATLAGLAAAPATFAQRQLPNAAIARESAFAESPHAFDVVTIKTPVAAQNSQFINFGLRNQYPVEGVMVVIREKRD